MPEDATHLDEELVWLKLVTACSLRPSGLEPVGQVRHDFQVAQRGYDDGETIDPEAGTEVAAQADHRRAVLQPYLDEREAELSTTITRILDTLEVPEPRADVVATLIALVEGLTLSACLGRLTPEQATELAIAHVADLGAGWPEGLARVGE
jgi:hypothetical protein